uniref:Uncharacterized protein n=1 Tax=Tanacetum cinerariifolium TaxID=118510 RepID=A0A699Q590_TANCI|nr:hypothetical protein [Tanacetum cinerariifolium]
MHQLRSIRLIDKKSIYSCITQVSSVIGITNITGLDIVEVEVPSAFAVILVALFKKRQLCNRTVLSRF